METVLRAQGIGEPVLFLGSSVFFAIKGAVAAARADAGLSGPFRLDSPATADRICHACTAPFIQKVHFHHILALNMLKPELCYCIKLTAYLWLRRGLSVACSVG